MKRDVQQLVDKTFDLVVIGGGIFGVCAAYDGAQRGLSVALIERGDFACGASGHSLKMIHGGIRYVQHLDIARLRHSASERQMFLKVAPHLVGPIPVVIPTYGYGMKGRQILRIGMAVFDMATLDCNRGITDPARRIPWCSSVSRQHVLEMYPGLEAEGLTGAAVFSDGQMYNPTRLVLAFLKSGVKHGVVAANYTEATGFLREAGKMIGVKARDVLSDHELEIRGRVVLNAAGPYAEKLLGAANAPLREPITYSRDTAFVVKRKLTSDGHAIALQGATSDPDARLSRGARHMFIAPWRDYTLIGVWHGVHRGDPDSFVVTDAELESYISQINQIYPAWQLSLDDVSICNAGLVPFGDNDQDSEDLRYGHRSHLIDHAQEHGIDNLITLIGVRYTTGRFEAQRAIDLTFVKLGHKPPRCRTASTAVAGGEISDFEQFAGQAELDRPHGLDAAVMRSLAHNYGTEYRAVLQTIDKSPQLAARVGQSTTILAEAIYAVDQEMAQTLGDVVFRRTDLATGEYPGRAALRTCARVVGSQLGWDESRIDQEMDQVASCFPLRTVTRIDGALPTEQALDRQAV